MIETVYGFACRLPQQTVNASQYSLAARELATPQNHHAFSHELELEAEANVSCACRSTHAG